MQAEDQLRVRLGESGVRAVTLRMPPLGENGMESTMRDRVSLVEAWREPGVELFFRNVWPLYLHEISGFDTDFYSLDESGRWTPDLVDDWLSPLTPPQNLREARAADNSAQPFQRSYVIAIDGRPVGFICVGAQPFAFMPADVDFSVSEFFLIHAARGTDVATRALGLLFERNPGRWSLQVIHDNARALRFWRRALPSRGVRDLEERRQGGEVEFRFAVGG
jgi:predicted acetyltransferase